MPPAKVGDSVTFYFMVSGERGLRNRRATVTRIYPDRQPGDEGAADVEAADLEVPFTPEETAAWGYAPQQRHKTYARGRRPISGEWQIPMTPN